MGKLKDLTGIKFGRLLVLERVPTPPDRYKNHTWWNTRCDCGNEKVVSANCLLQGVTKSCGCLRRENAIALNKIIDVRENILNSITIDEDTGCWNWNRGKSTRGYGMLSFGGEDKAHRVAYKEYIGDIPPGQVICHRCDNPSCVNPEHLFAGTQGDNIKDMDSKGRRNPAKGSANCNSKITETDVKEIRDRFNSGENYRDLMEEFGYKSHSSFYAMVKGKNWGHVV